MTERGRIVSGPKEGMGGFLNPPLHPERTMSVETDLRRRPWNRGRMSLSAALEATWLDGSTKAAAKRALASWEPLPEDAPEVQSWALSVLGYFAGCYSGQDKLGAISWNAGDLRIVPTADPMLNLDIHAGVHLIRKYYPAFTFTREHFLRAQWGAKATA